MEAQLREQKAEAAEVKKPNLTGIPTQMKLDFEQRSGLSFDDVRVHYNSDKPARLGALAYTQGTQIHVGPGHESSLPHELGHVIQQKAGRVRPTRWIGGLPVNDQPELEREADRAPVQCMPAPALWGVVQMQLVTMPRQSGNNCGYHALARALLQFQETGTVTMRYTRGNLADCLTSYAIQTGYSVIGEAFDAEALAHVGEQFCIDNHISATCSSIAFSSNDEFREILDDSRNKGSVILVPYFTGKDLMPATNRTQEQNAHWSAIDTALPQKDPPTEASPTEAPPTEAPPEKTFPYKLYEGNYYGSYNSFGKDEPPKDVNMDTLFISNQSIQPQFNWDDFIFNSGYSRHFPRERDNTATDNTREHIEAAVSILDTEFHKYFTDHEIPLDSEPEKSLQTKYNFIHSKDGKEAVKKHQGLFEMLLEVGVNYINRERVKYAGTEYEKHIEFITGLKTVTGNIETIRGHKNPDSSKSKNPATQDVNLRGFVVEVMRK